MAFSLRQVSLMAIAVSRSPSASSQNTFPRTTWSFAATPAEISSKTHTPNAMDGEGQTLRQEAHAAWRTSLVMGSLYREWGKSVQKRLE
eukprot:6772867-Prymnesium_polylepis.1